MTDSWNDIINLNFRLHQITAYYPKRFTGGFPLSVKETFKQFGLKAKLELNEVKKIEKD